MDKWTKILVINAVAALLAVIVLLVVVTVTHRDSAEPAVPAIADRQAVPTEVGNTSALDIFERISRAKILLKEHPVKIRCPRTTTVCNNRRGAAKRCWQKTSSYFCRKEIRLAAMNATTGEIQLITVNAETGKSQTPGFSVKRESRDGVDSEFEIRVPPGQLVVGLQFPLEVRTAKGRVAERAFYVPYTAELAAAFPEIVGHGWGYLRSRLTTARQEAERAGVDLSKIDTKVIATLVFIEHFTNEELSSSEVRREMNRVLFTLGANGGTAYRYSVSGVGARGLGQFMPATWKSLLQRYPTLVDREFFAGSLEHRVAFRAQFLLAKEDLQYLLNQKGWRGDNAPRTENFLADPRQVGEFLALAYNAGGPRATKWLSSDRKMAIPDEGRKYIRKFNQVFQILQDWDI
ncbi:MAG TPA: lytic transglycosylase domain-containing protein [Candidatus Magasanikbacteria bacterium]|nr:lytic transglycosylase domain-containing protein [Candidatus Magasanikbacteria bacterium]